MKRILYLMLLLMVVATVSGCLGGSTDKSETTIKNDEGTIKMKTETSGGGERQVETKIETEDGEQTVVITGSMMGNTDDWCPEGGNWDMKSTGVGGTATANMKIDKLVTTGKYAGLCHVVYTTKSPEGEMQIDYWFDESGKHGFYEMDINGQKISQEWTG
ncbi:hypothetical protein BMS3Bbin16_01205 [archaeon BMS3Bbin16]|nr:hypothetical protein BMS3Bbin16_01205 [archaeon BMS3Bbin16]